VHHLFCNLKLHSIITYELLLLGDLVPERTQLIHKQSDAKSEVLNALPCLELEFAEITPELVCVCLLDPVSSNVHCLDCLPCFSGGLLLCKPRLHLLWYNM
jgi:hypothetical protein